MSVQRRVRERLSFKLAACQCPALMAGQLSGLGPVGLHYGTVRHRGLPMSLEQDTKDLVLRLLGSLRIDGNICRRMSLVMC